MKSVWDTAIEFVLRMEGGETVELDPHDPGGMTKFGISKKAFPNLDIASLTRAQAAEIYRSEYWAKCRCDEMPAALALCVFDTAVNQGPGRAIRILQSALDVPIDGIIGPQTLAAAAIASPRRVMGFLARRLEAYALLTADNRDLLVFSRNWNFRVLSLHELILARAA